MIKVVSIGYQRRQGPRTIAMGELRGIDVALQADPFSLKTVAGLSVNVTAKNVLGTEHREFVGAPALGRMVVARLTYELPFVRGGWTFGRMEVGRDRRSPSTLPPSTLPHLHPHTCSSPALWANGRARRCIREG